jgi:GT2 family glycosyltransferase
MSGVWEFMEAHPEARISCPVVYSANGRMQGFFLKAGVSVLYFGFLKTLYMIYKKTAIRRARKPVKVDGVIGAFIFFRSSLAGPDKKLFDEDYFFYFEDADLAARLKNAGTRTYVLPGIGIVHLGGEGEIENEWKLFYKHKDLYVLKNFGAVHARAIRRLDHLKIAFKKLKYNLIKQIHPGKRVRAKYEYYTNLLAGLKDLY